MQCAITGLEADKGAAAAGGASHLQVVGVLPDVDAKQRHEACRAEGVLVGAGGDGQLA